MSKTTGVNEEILNINVCESCGSDSVESKMWVNINTNELTGGDEDEPEYFCNNCQKTVTIIDEDDFIDEDYDMDYKEED